LRHKKSGNISRFFVPATLLNYRSYELQKGDWLEHPESKDHSTTGLENAVNAFAARKTPVI